MRLPVIFTVVALAIVVAFGALNSGWMHSDTNTEEHSFRILTVASGLEFPWSLAFLPDGSMLVTERPGRLRVIRDGALDPRPIPGVPHVRAREQGGLMDIALHPKFAENRLLYLTYLKAEPGGATIALARATFDGVSLSNVQDIFVADAADRSDGNAGSRVLFGPDGMLYMSVGDRHDRKRPQSLSDHAGKIVRLRDDGSIPDDNPFVNQAGARPEIYAYGVRNPQGLAVNPLTGDILETEHGPQGGDELNLLRRGANYGWPAITYGQNYDGTVITNETARPGMEQPLAYWVPSFGPSGLVIYTGNKFPKWRGNVFLGAMAGTHLRRLVLEGTRVVQQELLLRGLGARIRDVRQGPDGFLYLLNDSPHGSVRRLEPEP